MDETCIWLKKVVEWIDQCGPPSVPYVGKATYGYRNRPAPHLEVLYLLDQGIEDISIGNRVVAIPPYHVAVHNVHQGNFTPTVQRFTSWCVFLHVEGVEAFAKLADEPLFCCAPLPLNEEVCAAYERLGALCVRYGTGPLAYDASGAAFTPSRPGGGGTSADLRVKAALVDLFALLLEAIDPSDPMPSYPRPVQHAIDFMSLHYRDPSIRLAEVAHASGLSPDHFGRLFRAHLGESPMHYLKRIRLNRACYLLEHTNLLVEQIALDVGFQDPFHFSRVFSALTSQSPRDWRRRGNAGG